MKTVAQAINIVTYVLETPRARTNQIARALIDAGILPKSSGRAIARIDAKQFAYLVTAVAMSDGISSAADTAKAYAELPVQDGGKTFSAWHVETFADMFALIFGSRNLFSEMAIDFNKVSSGVTATITTTLTHKGEPVELSLPFWRDKYWGGWCKTSFTISKEGIELMRSLFFRDVSAD